MSGNKGQNFTDHIQELLTFIHRVWKKNRRFVYEKQIEEKTTDANGQIVWSDLKHGTYYVKETMTGADDLNDKGYGISDEVAEVVIESGALVKDVIANDILNKQVTFEAPLNAGIRILKTNETSTGDNTAVMPYIIICAVGAGGCIALGIDYIRRKRKDA